MHHTGKPIGVATYQIVKRLPKELKGQLPAPEEIAKLLKAFAEVTGIRATPAWVEAVLWRQAQTIKPLGRSHVWDAGRQLGLCGDWCLGHRVEDAFLSGLELALQLA